MSPRTIPLADILLTNRQRNRPLPLAVAVRELAGAIKRDGLDSPILVTPGPAPELIDGLGRVLAAQSLGWTDIPAREVNLDAKHRDHRTKPFACDEVYGIWTFIKQGVKRGRPKRGEVRDESGKATARTAELTWRSTRAVEQIVAVMSADPRVYGDIQALLVKSDRVARSYNQYKRKKALRELPRVKPSRQVREGDVEGVLPKLAAQGERFSCAILDPPWNVKPKETYNGRKYKKMEVEDYGAYLMRIHALVKPLIRPGGFIAWLLPQVHFPHFVEWFGDKDPERKNNGLRLFAFGNALFDYDHGNLLGWGWSPVVLCWQGTDKQVVAQMPFGRPWGFDWFPADVRAHRADKLGKLHECSKPVDCLAALISALVPHGKNGGRVLDCFAGSGSTSVAAKLVGRGYLAIERDPEFANLIRARLESVMGTDLEFIRRLQKRMSSIEEQMVTPESLARLNEAE